MVEIDRIIPGSIADEMDLVSGDKIVTINGKSIRDFIDFEYETADNFFVIKVKKTNNSIWELEIEKDYNENLGIRLNKIIYDDLKTCNNKCIFCFVDQQPEGLRKSLKIKDDDYRFSFLQGSYITLTNLNDHELERIIRYNLSPLYISVHTTDPSLRKNMMQNNDAAKIREQLKLLAENGIQFHTQIVLCPDINDGRQLDKTIKDLISLYPAVKSIGLVPVGLTKYRDNLSKLRSYNKERAINLLKQVKTWQQKIKKKYSQNYLYAADEFYLLADIKIPEYKDYNDFPQLENGIGLTRKLWTEFEDLKTRLPVSVNNKKYGIVTGELGKKAILPVIKELNAIKGLEIEIISVKNKFYGKSVTVTGLLTASDIKRVLENYNFTSNILIPEIVINDQSYFIDGKTVEWLRKELTAKKLKICSSFNDLMEVIINE